MNHQTALEIFRYDPGSGKLYWADHIPRHHFDNDRLHKRFNTLFAGKLTGTPDSGGYLQTRWKRRLYITHRIIWLIMYGAWPEHCIDHQDHDRQHNRTDNMDDVSFVKNVAHKKNNKSGHPCIFFQKRNTNRPWMVQVFSNGKYLTQQSFQDLDDAITHRDQVRREHGLPSVQTRTST